MNDLLEIQTHAEEVATSTSGSDWVSLPDVVCHELFIYNETDVAIEWRRVDEPDNSIPLPAGVVQPLQCDSSASVYQIRRQDQSNEPLTLPLTLEIVISVQPLNPKEIMSIASIDNNPRNRIRGTGRVLFAEGIICEKDYPRIYTQGFTDLGNIMGLTYQADIEIKRTKSHINGRRRVDKTYSNINDIFFTAEATELLNKEVFKFAYQLKQSSQDNIRTALGAVAGNTITYSASEPLPTGVWIPLQDAVDNEVQHLTAITLRGTANRYGAAGNSINLEKGIDYEIDLQLGAVMFLKPYTGSDTITPTLTAAAIDEQSNEYAVSLEESPSALTKGLFKINLHDEDPLNNLAMQWLFFGSITMDGNVETAGEDEAKVSLKILVDKVKSVSKNVRSGDC